MVPMVIDCHVHVGAWNHADFLGLACDLGDTLATLARAGVQGAALMPSDRLENEALFADVRAAVERGHPGPLWFLAWVRPATGDGAGEADLQFVRAHAGEVAGLKLHPSLARRRASDDAYRPALQLAEELGLAVLVHCGRWAEIAGFAHALDAAARHPGARFILAHAGGDTPPNAVAAARAVAERRLANVWFDIAGLREHWVIERNVALLGAGRYLLGSDHPLAHPRMYLGAVAGMRLSDDERRLILGENARAVLGAPLAARADDRGRASGRGRP